MSITFHPLFPTFYQLQSFIYLHVYDYGILIYFLNLFFCTFENNYGSNDVIDKNSEREKIFKKRRENITNFINLN